MVTDGEQGFIVPVGDSHSLASRLTMLADQPLLRERLGMSARNKVEQSYRIEQTARAYESLLLDLVGSR
jgi:glycosyltransferase involved in cell wall biosynthesis